MKRTISDIKNLVDTLEKGETISVDIQDLLWRTIELKENIEETKDYELAKEVSNINREIFYMSKGLDIEVHQLCGELLEIQKWLITHYYDIPDYRADDWMIYKGQFINRNTLETDNAKTIIAEKLFDGNYPIASYFVNRVNHIIEKNKSVSAKIAYEIIALYELDYIDRDFQNTHKIIRECFPLRSWRTYRKTFDDYNISKKEIYSDLDKQPKKRNVKTKRQKIDEIKQKYESIS